MKKIVFLLVVALFAAPNLVLAAHKAKLGPCVRDCVQAFNPSLADSGADEFVITDIEQQDCVDWCKGVTEYGDCGFWTDGCCYTDLFGFDPDCGELPAGSDCTDNTQCASGECKVLEGETIGVCLAAMNNNFVGIWEGFGEFNASGEYHSGPITLNLSIQESSLVGFYIYQNTPPVYINGTVTNGELFFEIPNYEPDNPDCANFDFHATATLNENSTTMYLIMAGTVCSGDGLGKPGEFNATLNKL